MYEGDTRTIAEKGVSTEEMAEALQAMAREEIGSRLALWDAIHNDRKCMYRRMQVIAVIALVAIALVFYFICLNVFSQAS